jgi:hypothetical protein
MNSVVMAAALNEYTLKRTRKIVNRTPKAPLKDAQRIYRDELPPPLIHWKQLLTHPKMTEFLEACKVEIEQLLKIGVWNVVPQSSIKGKLIPLKWVFTYKFDQDGYLIKYKARIVVQGDLQPKGSLDSTYAATLAAKSFRALMAFAAEHDLEI